MFEHPPDRLRTILCDPAGLTERRPSASPCDLAPAMASRSAPGAAPGSSPGLVTQPALRSAWLAGLGSCLAFVAASAQAQGESATGITTLPTVQVRSQSVQSTDPYPGGQVATGSRVGLLGNKDVMETPFSTISYTDAFIANRQAQDITGVIAATDPTVFSNGVTGAWSENYSIRGFSAGTTDLTMNGLFGIAPFYRTSPEMFERIEVLKGPSALLNGMPPGGSVGGAVNLVPKRAGNDPLTRLTASYVSDAQMGAHLDVGRRFGEAKQFGLRFNGVYRNGESAVRDQDKKLQLGSLGLDWRGARARVSADFYTSNDQVDGQTRGINLAPGLAVPRPPRADTGINPAWAFVETRDRGAMVRGEFDISDQWLAYAAMGTSKTRYQYNGAISAQVLDVAGNYRTTIGQLAFEVEKKSAELGIQGGFRTGGIGHRVTINATHYQHDQDDFGRRSVPGADWTTNLYDPTWGPAADFVAPHISQTALRLNSYGIADTLSFAEDRIQLTLGLRRQQVVSDTFNVTTGARTARYDEGATTPAAALLVRLSQRLSVYGNVIEGLSQGATAPLTAANPGEVFPPYKTKQKEVGLKVETGDFIHTVGLFEIKRPSSYTDPVTNIYSFDGEQRNRGIEWGFFGSPLRGLRLMGGIAWIRPELTRTAGGVNQGRQATGVPRLQAKLGAEWDLAALPGLTVTGNATAASKQYISADNSLAVPGRTIYDAGARYATRIAERPVVLRANVTNLTNKAYWGMPLLSSLALGAPRTIWLSGSVDF